MEENQEQTNYAKLIFGMMTAIACGATLAFSAIFIFRYTLTEVSNIKNQTAIITIASSTAKMQFNEEDVDEDPSYISRFSRVFMYSADNGKEIIESTKNSLPRLSTAKVSALSYVVIDYDRDAIVLERDSNKLLPIASITKLITAVVAKKLLKSTTQIEITKKILGTYGNEAWLREGEKFRPEELLYPLLMVSSNDSAEALAQAYPHGRKAFIKEMNDWVNTIGAYRTSFDDPSGLSYRNVSTSKDLSIIIKWIIHNDPDLFKITLLRSKTIRTHTWVNHTHFLNLASYAGGKNGYTPEANRTGVSLFNLGRDRKLFGIIILGSKNRDSDMLDLLEETVR